MPNNTFSMLPDKNKLFQRTFGEKVLPLIHLDGMEILCCYRTLSFISDFKTLLLSQFNPVCIFHNAFLKANSSLEVYQENFVHIPFSSHGSFFLTQKY
jgi:hypothetical protein